MATTVTAGDARDCCRSGANLRVIDDTPRLTVRQCVAPAADGLLEVDGVRVCGRRHFRAKLIGLGTRAAGAGLGS